MGIRAKLFCCLIAVLLPLSVFSTYAFHLFEQQIRDRTESALANTQRIEADRISELLAGYAQDARSLASDPHVRDFLSAIDHHTDLAATDSQRPMDDMPKIGGVDGLAIVDLKDEWPLRQLTLDLQQKARVAGPSAVEIRLVDRQGRTLGESVGFSWTPAIEDLTLQSMATVKTRFGDAFVTDANEQRLGLISPVISPAGEVVGALMLETQLGPIIDIISLHEGAGKTTEAYLAQASIQKIDSSGWGLVVKIDSAEAYAPLDKLRKSLIIAGFISLLLILAGYTIFLGPIAHRLKKTAGAAEKIINGNLSARVSDFRNDEIGNMARTIDSLAMQLEQDQRKRLRVEEQLRHQATHDELTGLFNRKFANKLIRDLDNNKSSSHAILFLDLNGFKDVNDFHGHAAGDEVLVVVSERLRNKNPVRTAEGCHDISISIGLALSAQDKALQEALIEADTLMYEEKKNRQSNRSIQVMRSRTIERALQENRVEIWYEPIVRNNCNDDSSKCSTLLAAEAKIRVRSMDGGVIAPEDLLRDLDDDKLATSLFRFAFSQCLSSLERWNETGIISPKFKLYFELDAAEHSSAVIRSIADLLTTDGANVLNRIVLKLSDYDQADTRYLEQLRNSGLHLAKTYGAEFATKRDLPRDDLTNIIIFDATQIDQSSRDELVNNCNQQNIDAIACGVDSDITFKDLSKLGVTAFQGQLFDTPLKAVDFISRWGHPSHNALIPLSNKPFYLRPTG